MAFNIVNTIIGAVAPSVIDRLAAALGVNGGVARSALSAAVPAVLGAFGSKATTDVGARALFDAVTKTDTSMLGDLASTLGGASAEKFIQGGLGTLGSLLGENGLKGLTGAIARQTGIGGDASSSLVSLAGQLAMGQLAKSVANDGLTPASLAGLLSSQQNNIAAALPAGLGGLLSGAGVIGSSFAGSAARAAGTATTQAAHAASAAQKAGVNWLAWLLPILAVLAGLWYFLGQGTQHAVQEAANTATALVVDGVDVKGQVTSAFDGLKTTLGSITDAASAEAALPKLNETVASIDGLTALTAKLSAEQRNMLAGLISAGLPALKELAAKVLAIPGVGDVAKPTIDGLLTKVEALAKAA